MFVIVACSMFFFRADASSPDHGSIAVTGPVAPFTGTWVGTGTGTPPSATESTCIEGTNCDSFKLTIAGQPNDWIAAGKQVHVEITWTSNSTDYDMYVHKGALDGPLVATSGAGGTTIEKVDLNPRRSNVGTGDFYVHVVYFAASPADQYHGAASVRAAPPPAPAATQATGTAPRYQNYTPPAAGINTLGRNSGEPSLGVGLPVTGHPEGRTLFQSDVQTLRVTFNAACATPRAIWEDKSPATSQQDFDPILFTDRQTGRTIVSLLTFAANTIAGESSFTDTASPFNDGDVWTPANSSGIASGVDHQTLGGGPYAPPLNISPPTAYPHAVYYCSQALVDANCARSDNGGSSYGPSVVIYTSECGGLHGHVKVAPDGTVYVPNRGCDRTKTTPDGDITVTEQAVVVSEDNGLTWNIRNIFDSSPGESDPSVGIGRGDAVTGGRVYFGYADANLNPVMAVSDNHGVTWTKIQDVGASLGLNNVVFPEVVAGDDARAAFSFLGTPTIGGSQTNGFNGVWHLYVAHTYDGGTSWVTVDATPNDPVQRGCIWLSGGAVVCRNLLDFMDVTTDNEGRVVVAYADGCAGAECAQAPQNATGNSFTALAAIARQTGGRRLFAANDPPDTPNAPGPPSITARRDGAVAHVAWSEPDTGGSAITQYKIFRGTASGGETLLTTLAGTQTKYDDATATNSAATYFYKVSAVNGQGESCGNEEVAARFVGDSCTGIRVAVDPADDQKGGPAGNKDMDIREVTVSEPGNLTDKLVFKMKVADLTTVPAGRRWRVIWDYSTSPGAQYFVGMTADSAGAVQFDYGTVTTATVGLVLGVPTETRVGAADAESNFTTDGTITLVISKSKVGSPTVGDVLGGISARNFSDSTNNDRTTAAVDSTTGSTPATGNAVANDDTTNAAAYSVAGNNLSCLGAPTPTPTVTPTPTPSVTPTPTPTVTPTPSPTVTPTPTPTVTPTPSPTVTPTPTPSVSPTPTPTPGTTSTFQFSQSVYAAPEDCTQTNVTITRLGITSNRATVDLTSSDGTAKQKGDFTFVVGRLTFEPGDTQKVVPVLICEDNYTEGPEQASLILSNPTSNTTLGVPSTAMLQIADDASESTANPIDDPRTFACQHYHDFLARDAVGSGDQAGLDFWTNQTASCGDDAACLDARRINVSAAFFLSIEFQQTGYLVIRAHKAAFGSDKSNPRYAVFLRDQREISEGVIIGQPGAETRLEQNKQKYFDEFVSRPEFVTQFPQGSAAATFVDKLFANAGVTPTTAERSAAISAYGSGDQAGRIGALRSVVESNSIFQKHYNPAFVLTQYFGYLRRNPDDAPDNNFSGYDFWLNKLNQFSLPNEDVHDETVALKRVQRAEMVKAFLISIEYRQRFGGSPSGNQQSAPPEESVGSNSWTSGLFGEFLRQTLAQIVARTASSG
jgi:hypothetical protein